jgi:hypothetical protein
MKIVDPIVVTDAVLTASNVPETPPTAYAGGTTYAENDTASVITGLVAAVYRSLSDGNTGHTPASSPTWWELVGSTYKLYDVAHTYAADDIVIDAVGHHAYQSLGGSNLGNALSDDTKWLDLGPDNRWKMFDQSVQSQTTAEHEIHVTLAIPGRADTVSLQNVDAASARVILTDATDGVVYDQWLSLVSPSGITDWYAWFFTPIERVSTKTFTGLPPYANATLEVILSDQAPYGGDGRLDFSDRDNSGFEAVI